MKESKLTIAEALKEASALLQNQKEAAILLCHHLQCERLYLFTHDREILEDTEGYFRLIRRRLQYEPIEYITNNVSFYGRDFYIAPGALIPRPETELLIDKAKSIITQEHICHIAEIGTGSGIVSIMLALFFPSLEITATDISLDALKIAKINAEKFGLAERINFVHAAYLDGINQMFDIIISNPPYIARDFPLEKPLSYEPQNALYAGERGDEILCKIIDLAAQKNVGYLLCEMGYDQKAFLSTYMRNKEIVGFSFYKDYSGFDRGFTVKIKE